MTKIEISWKTILLIFGLVILYTLFFRIEYILVLIILAYIIMAAMDPIVRYFEGKRIHRSLVIASIYSILVFFIILFFGFIVVPLLHESVDLYAQFPILMTRLVKTVPFTQQIPGINTTLSDRNLHSLSKNATQSLIHSNGAIGRIYQLFVDTTRTLAAIITIIVMSIYMLLDKKRHASMMLRVIPLNYRERAVIIMQKVEKKLGRWVQAQLLLSVIIFIISYFSLSVLHIKFALTISLIAGFCEIIPIAGSIVANTIAVILTLFISPDKVIYVLIIAILIHQLEAHVLVPQVMRKVIGLSPLITIISLIIGAELVGFIGAVLSVPIAAIFQILYLEIFKND